MWTTMVLITKEGGQYKSIGMFETIWKVCTSIMNNWIQNSIVLLDFLHGFHQGRGTGTAVMEAKLEQQLSGIVNKPIFQVFINFSKTNDSLDQGVCMEIQRGYGLGPRLQQLIQRYWDGHSVFPKSWKWWQTHGELRGGGLVGRWSGSRNQNWNRNWKGEGGRGGFSTCWDGDKIFPGGRMTSCVRQRSWVGDGGRPYGRMNQCDRYGRDQNTRKGKVR